MKQPVGTALSTAQKIFHQLELNGGAPALQGVTAAIRRFAQIEFDVPPGPDSDGFLFQYGPVNWFPEPTFTVGFVRQMELVDAGGEHEGYSQVQFEYRYIVDADLRSLESQSSWWFHGGASDFGEWLDLMQRNAIWQIVEGKSPVGFYVTQELV